MGTRRRFGFLLALLGLVAGLMTVVVPSASAAPPGYYQLAADNTNPFKCLTVRTTDNGARAVQYNCNPGYNDQNWQFRATGAESEWFWIYKYNSGSPGKCLVVQGSANGAPAQQQTCSDRYYDQFWRYYRIDGNRFMLQRYSPDGNGKCLIVRGNDNESPVVQTTCAPQYADQWWHAIY
jgi:hypothetical protein